MNICWNQIFRVKSTRPSEIQKHTNFCGSEIYKMNEIRCRSVAVFPCHWLTGYGRSAYRVRLGNKDCSTIMIHKNNIWFLFIFLLSFKCYMYMYMGMWNISDKAQQRLTDRQTSSVQISRINRIEMYLRW